MSNKKPVISILIPAPEVVCTGFAMSLAWLCVHSAKDFDVRVIHSKSSNIAIVRNNAVNAAKLHRADYALFLDSDMTFPRDTLHRLFAHQKDIVGATYPQRTSPFMMLGIASSSKDLLSQEGLIEMDYIPTGCLLIKMSVFDKMDRPFFRCPFDEVQITGEDVDFCERARERGFTVWNDIDLSKEIGHIGAKEYKYDSPEVLKTMEEYKDAQAQAMVTPIAISVLIPSRGRPDMLKMAVMALDHLESGNNKVTYCIAVDSDDQPTLKAAESLANNGNVTILVGDRPDGIGKLYNTMARNNPADAYLPFADDIIPLSQDWDVKIAQGVQQYPVFAWHDHFNGKFPSYPIISKAWYEAAAGVYCEYFPFWFNDTYLNEVVAMVTGNPIPIATDLPVGGRRGKTMRMRDLSVWIDLLRVTRAERMVEAEMIRTKLGLPAPPVGRMALSFEQTDIYLASNIERFEHLFAENEPVTPEYLAALEIAKERIGRG